jgi:signal transduction histidine kinase
MTANVSLYLIYGLITLGSAIILYFSFKDGVDSSGKYFLLADFLVLATVSQLFITALYPSLFHPVIFFTNNLVQISSEIAIVFSLHGLKNKNTSKSFIFCIMLVALYCGFIEYCRYNIDPKLPLLVFPILSLVVAGSTWIIYQQNRNNELGMNLFFRWICYLQVGIATLALFRIIAYFFGIYLNPRDQSGEIVLFFAILVTLNIFRYISYQSLRISWASPIENRDNLLNRNYVKLVEEKNQFLDRLISSNRAIGISALANSIAHQFSQPLTGIIFQTELIKRDLQQSGAHSKSLETLNSVSTQLEKLSALISNLRRLFGNRDRGFQSVSIQTVCNEILEVVTPTLESKQIQLRKTYLANPNILCNPIQIQQVLVNLFNNSIDAFEENGTRLREIHLIINKTNEFGTIAIRDTGSGISETMLSVIFELYQSSKPNGLGIGLWLSKEIIDQHSGAILIRNHSEGGAIAEISIPLAPKDA